MRMALIVLNLRDMRTDERMLAEFDSLDGCEQWLRARPAFVEVLGPATDPIAPEVDTRLRAALRPLDEAERAHLDAERARTQRALTEAAEAEAARMQAEYKERMAALGPDDPMALRWDPEQGVQHAEPLDGRPITNAARAAVEAWVEERQSWIEGRGQKVGEALVTVYPGELPAGQERVQSGGQFVPVSV